MTPLNISLTYSCFVPTIITDIWGHGALVKSCMPPKSDFATGFGARLLEKARPVAKAAATVPPSRALRTARLCPADRLEK